MTKAIMTLVVSSLLLSIFSCAPNEPQENSPHNLEGKQALLVEKKEALKELQAEIEALKTDIDKLNPNKQKRSKLVTTMPVEKKDFSKFIDVQGTIASEDLVTVSSAVGGRLLRVYVKEGQAVKRGATIAKIDMETTANQKRELEISLDLATNVYERQERLWKQNIGSEIQYLEAKSNKERIEKSIETLNSQLSKSRVYAPISGVVDREFLSSGEMSAPGSPIVSILNTSNVKVVVDLPESYLGIVKKGNYVDITIPALDKEIRSRVSLIGRTIDPANRTFKVEVNLKNSSGDLKPNLLAEMRINELTLKDATVVPLNLVQEEVSGKRYLYVSEENGEQHIAKKRYIEIGESYNDEVTIVDGLTGDEMIIADGARNIVEGEVITLTNKEEE